MKSSYIILSLLLLVFTFSFSSAIICNPNLPNGCPTEESGDTFVNATTVNNTYTNQTLNLSIGQKVYNSTLNDTVLFIDNVGNLGQSTYLRYFNGTLNLTSFNGSRPLLLTGNLTGVNNICLSNGTNCYNWNGTGYIKNWNATGYIRNWNSTGFIKNWTIIFNTTQFNNQNNPITINLTWFNSQVNQSGLIKDWNATGLIRNDTINFNSTQFSSSGNINQTWLQNFIQSFSSFINTLHIGSWYAVGNSTNYYNESYNKEINQYNLTLNTPEYNETTNVTNCTGGGGITITGGTVSYDGAYTVRTFTSDGTLYIGSGEIEMEVLIVGGGGSGGSGYGGAGGGGAGGVLAGTVNLTADSYTVIVGDGGATAVSSVGNAGENSSLGNYTAYGGGGGGYLSNGFDGGSGGGASFSNAYGGSATQDSQSPLTGYGYWGGGSTSSGGEYGGGGGGGASTNGTDGTDSYGGNGGDGYYTSINGTSTCFAGGGGGAGASNTVTCGAGQGGQAPDPGTGTAGNPATANSGSGGGGGHHGYSDGGAGGSGIVIVRYLTPESDLTTNLIAYFPLDTDTSDYSTLGNNATNYGATATTGKVNGAYAFDGTDDYMQSDFGLGGRTGNISTNVWFQYVEQSDYYKIFDAGDYYNTNKFDLLVTYDNLYSSNTGQDSNEVVNTATWYMATWVYDQSNNNLSLYINGVLDRSDYINPTFANYNFLLGARFASDSDNSTDTTWNFYGDIDEMAVWDKALSTAEISQLYNSGDGLSLLGAGEQNCTTTQVNVTRGGNQNILSANDNQTVLGSANKPVIVPAFSSAGYVCSYTNGTIYIKGSACV